MVGWGEGKNPSIARVCIVVGIVSKKYMLIASSDFRLSFRGVPILYVCNIRDRLWFNERGDYL